VKPRKNGKSANKNTIKTISTWCYRVKKGGERGDGNLVGWSKKPELRVSQGGESNDGANRKTPEKEEWSVLGSRPKKPEGQKKRGLVKTWGVQKAPWGGSSGRKGRGGQQNLVSKPAFLIPRPKLCEKGSSVLMPPEGSSFSFDRNAGPGQKKKKLDRPRVQGKEIK